MLPRPTDTPRPPRAWHASSTPATVACHHRTVGDRIGIMVARNAPAAVRRELATWKTHGCPAADPLPERMAADLVALLRAWCPCPPSGWVVTTPPQGASAPGPYGAGMVACAVAAALDLDCVTTLERTDAKRWHGRYYSLHQEPYRVCQRVPSVALVVDDLLTSRTTMRLALEALAAAGVPAFGFVWGVTIGAA